MNEKTDRILARQEAALEKGGALMWRHAIAETVLILLEEDGQITRDSLRRAIAARADHEGTNRLLRASYRGALNALEGRPPMD